MPGLEFSVPYNDDIETLDEVLSLRERSGNRIREVYLNAPQDIMGSGRVGGHLTEQGFLKIVERIHAADIRVDITMNSTCEGADWYRDTIRDQTIDFIRKMHEQHGVEAVTLANPFLIEAARDACPDIEIAASVLSDIDCFSRARVFADAGATVMTVDTAINRNVKLLKQIAVSLGVEIKLMVNEGCLYKCPYRKFHMNYISHRSRELANESTEFSFACGNLIEADPTEIFKSNWVPPEDLKRYAGITGFFKIVGRDMLRSKVLRAVRAYMDEGYDGNLLDLLCSSVGFQSVEKSAFIDNKAFVRSGYFKRLSDCNRKCHTCDYCASLVRQYLRYGRITRENLEDMGEYSLIGMVEAQFNGDFPACDVWSEEPRDNRNHKMELMGDRR